MRLPGLPPRNLATIKGRGSGTAGLQASRRLPVIASSSPPPDARPLLLLPSPPLRLGRPARALPHPAKTRPTSASPPHDHTITRPARSATTTPPVHDPRPTSTATMSSYYTSPPSSPMSSFFPTGPASPHAFSAFQQSPRDAQSLYAVLRPSNAHNAQQGQHAQASQTGSFKKVFGK
ncbi:hypothetical protein C2E23DRAFT_840312 [Lenzites betulinus]|nr:hypothetical protein C2E23DRAFT_840312 [Lenzites betulinus]